MNKNIFNFLKKYFLIFLSYLIEIDENLFNLPSDVALAHCVAEDLRMGFGIAGEFK
jgi:hypothetical protein